MKSKLHGVHDYFIEDHERQQRTLIPELIYCENKSVEQIVLIAKKLYAKQKLVLGTRCPMEFFPKLKKAFPSVHIVQESHCFRIGKPLKAMSTAKVGLVSAGTTDIAVCEEAALILESLGVSMERVYDVGVAGIHRLFAKDDQLKRCSVLIVAAGMEGALPSVVAGLYPQPLIAIPTSTGYGTALSGFTALFAMLTSCAPGVTVVNIDNGVGAAAAAFKIISLNR
ncbi:MAG: nickel pincer cofactor biosynthesis protein LarB [Bacteroidota bacterium]|jgi:NCAIR mutase (PurE)-related protein